jgi:hypothetical protein
MRRTGVLSGIPATGFPLGATLVDITPASAESYRSDPNPVVDFTILPTVRILDGGRTAEMTIKNVCAAPEGTPDQYRWILLQQHPGADRIIEYQTFMIRCDGIPRQSVYRYDAALHDRPFVPGRAVVETAWTECSTFRDENGQEVWWYCFHPCEETTVTLKR